MRKLIKIEIVEIADNIACFYVETSDQYFHYDLKSHSVFKRVFSALTTKLDECVKTYRKTDYNQSVFYI